MCGGGSGASKRAEAAEQERTAQVARSTAAIDKAFAGRSGQLDDFLAALRENFTTEAQRQKRSALCLPACRIRQFAFQTNSPSE